MRCRIPRNGATAMLEWIADAWNAMPMWMYEGIRWYGRICLIGTVIGVSWQLLRNREEAEK